MTGQQNLLLEKFAGSGVLLPENLPQIKEVHGIQAQLSEELILNQFLEGQCIFARRKKNSVGRLCFFEPTGCNQIEVALFFQ